MNTENKPAMAPSGMICRRLIRGIVILNAIFYLIYWLSPAVGVSINGALRNFHLYNASYYWFILSTVALPILLATEVVRRTFERKRLKSPMEIRLFDSGVWIDSVLVAGWIVAALWAVARGAAAV